MMKKQTLLSMSLFLALLGAGSAGAAGSARAQDPTVPSARPVLDEIALSARATAAAMLGVDEDKILLDTDLVADLGADPMTAFEVLVVLCDEAGVVLPEDSALTRFGDIVDHLRTAEKVDGGEELIFRGGSGGEKAEVFYQRVFFATDRERLGGTNWEKFFGPGRSEGGRTHYGTCEVSIPLAVHRKGKLERPSFWRLELRENPERHIVLAGITPLAPEAMFGLLDSTLAEADHNPNGDVLVFLHGFNVSFAAAARRTAQMAFDLEFAGVPMFFSWPSDGALTAYHSDREDVEWAVLHVERFLLDLKERTEAGRIHLIAHSMGNQAMIRTLYNLALRNEGREIEPLFENIIMAAPDFDAHRFTEQIAPRVTGLAKRWTLYASEKDFALDLSSAIAARRLGLPIAVPPGVDTVDASGIDVAPWSVPETHGYFSAKQRVIQDLKDVLQGLEPGERDLRRQRLDGETYWALPPVRD